MSDRPTLRVVDTETGEVQDECASCLQYERDIRVLKARITRMERDEEAEARKHKLWAEAEAVHDWWALACGHPGVKFGAEEFHQVLPRLKERDVGLIGVLKAVAGAAFDPNTKRMKNGRMQRFDSFELIMRSRPKCDSFRERAPGRADGEEWKRWLVQRIEEALS